jgi:hypothetical protein
MILLQGISTDPTARGHCKIKIAIFSKAISFLSEIEMHTAYILANTNTLSLGLSTLSSLSANIVIHHMYAALA